jgi:hypothetical protein
MGKPETNKKQRLAALERQTHRGLSVGKPATNKKQRLAELERQIVKGYKAFLRTGEALLEIRDDELYRAGPFATWEEYLRDQVVDVFGIEARQARNLILCVQVRKKLGNRQHAADETSGEYSQRVLLEYARLAPRKEDEPGRPYDVDKLDEYDLARVRSRVAGLHTRFDRVRHDQISAAYVREVVDQELGIDRESTAREKKRKRGEAEARKLGTLLAEGHNLETLLKSLRACVGDAQAKLVAVPAEAWKQYALDWHNNGKDSNGSYRGDLQPPTVTLLIRECEALAAFLKRSMRPAVFDVVKEHDPESIADEVESEPAPPKRKSPGRRRRKVRNQVAA